MKMTGAEIIVQVLMEQEVDTVFGYIGGFVINIYDELYKKQDRITHYATCHEQGAAHAADGYARATGKVGVVIATSGPGATNLVTGIAAAFLDSTPMVAITGNVPTEMLGRDSFQEVDIAGVTMPVTKHNYIAKDITKLADILREAFMVAKSGRPGPVLVDVPKDVQIAVTEFTPKGPAGYMPHKCSGQADLDAAAALIAESKRPFLYVGGGVVLSDASETLLEFAEKIDAAIGTSMMGQSAIPASHPRHLGMVGMHGRYAATKALNECDLLIAVGARFSDRATGNKAKFSQGHRVLHIDIDPAEIGKNITAYTSVIGDVKDVLQALLAILPHCSPHPEWHSLVAGLRESPENDHSMARDRLTPQMVIEAVRGHMPEDGIVATDVGQHQLWTAQYYPFAKSRTFITSGGLGAMGFGMGAAIGACIGTGKKRTVLFTSDGSLHMNMNEIATAVSTEVPLVIVVLNNQVLGMVRQWQKLFFDGRYSNTILGRKTDFAKLAESLGADGFKVNTPEELEPALAEAFARQTPVLIDCMIDPDERVLPMIPPNGSIDDIILR